MAGFLLSQAFIRNGLPPPKIALALSQYDDSLCGSNPHTPIKHDFSPRRPNC